MNKIPFEMNITNVLWSSIVIAQLTGIATQAALYQLDNGGIQFPLNASDGTEPRDNWFGNVFTAQSGGNVITRVDFGPALTNRI